MHFRAKTLNTIEKNEEPSARRKDDQRCYVRPGFFLYLDLILFVSPKFVVILFCHDVTHFCQPTNSTNQPTHFCQRQGSSTNFEISIG